MTAWLPTYWKEFYQVSAVTAGSLTALYSLTASIMRVFGGTLADRLGGEKTALIALGTSLVGGMIMTTSFSYSVSILGVVLMALGMGVANAAVFKLMPQYIPQAVGGAAGWIGGLGAFGGFAIPPILVTFVAVQGTPGYAFGFITFVILCLLSMGLAFNLIRSRQTMRKLRNAPTE